MPYKVIAEFSRELPGKIEMGINSPDFKSGNITRVPHSCTMRKPPVKEGPLENT